MSRWIDADAMIARACQDSERLYLESVARHTPSIDIVRCKECVRRKKNGFCLEHNRYEKNDNGYCSYGEREGE